MEGVVVAADAEVMARLTRELKTLDVTKEPGRVAAGALLLEELQEHERQGQRLVQRVSDFLARSTEAASDGRSLADRAAEVLRDAGKPMRYREIAAEIRGRGFQHSRQPKNPDQLADSTWSAMFEDPAKRFIKVGRGIWDLSERNQGAAT
jgi:hypothetical protein